MGVSTGAKTSAKRRDKTCFIFQGQHGKAIGGNKDSRVLEPDPHHGDKWLYPSPSLTHPSPFFQRGNCCFKCLFPSMGEWKDPAPPCRHLPCTAAGSSAQSPGVPSIILEAAAAGGELPWSELPSDTGHCGASAPSVHNSALLPLPSLCGGAGCCGGEDGCRKKQGEGGAENQSHTLLSSATSSFLCKVGGGALEAQLRTQ